MSQTHASGRIFEANGAPPPGPGVFARGPDASHRLAVAWLTTLEDRPFKLSTQRLEWVGGDLVLGEARPRRMRIAAGRFAGLFADHVAQDMGAEGAPGAYALVWQCARSAFIESMRTTQAAP